MPMIRLMHIGAADADDAGDGPGQKQQAEGDDQHERDGGRGMRLFEETYLACCRCAG